MTSSLPDQLTIKNIKETLDTLVEDIVQTYRSHNIPVDELEIRKLIWTVNESSIAEIELLEKTL